MPRMSGQFDTRAVILMCALLLAMVIALAASGFVYESNVNAEPVSAQKAMAQTERNNAETARNNAESERTNAESARRLAFVRELTTNALMQLPSDYELATLLAREALRTAPHTLQAEDVLLTVLLDPTRPVLRGHINFSVRE